jgi:hypothetical protein
LPRRQCAERRDRLCPLGTSDGFNCYVGPLPSGSTPFIWNNSLYVTPQTGGGCGLGTDDGASCLIGYVGQWSSEFTYNNSVYVTPVGQCSYSNYDGYNCYMGTAPAGTSPFMWPNSTGSFYYPP